MLRKSPFLAAAAIALCATAGGAALAAAVQNNPPQRPAPNVPAPDARADFRDSRLEARLAFIKSELRITAAQSQAWDAYADAVRSDAREREAARGNPPQAQRGRPSMVDMLADRQQRLTAESARLGRMLAALKPLYATFSDDQRRMADRLLWSDYGPPTGMRMRFPPRMAYNRRFGGGYYR